MGMKSLVVQDYPERRGARSNERYGAPRDKPLE